MAPKKSAAKTAAPKPAKAIAKPAKAVAKPVKAVAKPAPKVVKSAAHLQAIANKWNHSDLLNFWDLIKSREPVPDWSPGKAFEYLIIRAFELAGLDVRWPFEVTYPQKFGTMEQIDGLVYLGERAFIVESKDLSDSASIEALAKLRFRLESRPPGTMGILFSFKDFTLATEVFAQFASPLNVLLWGGSDLDIAIKGNSMKSSLEKKLKHAHEHGLPLYALGGVK